MCLKKKSRKKTQLKTPNCPLSVAISAAKSFFSPFLFSGMFKPRISTRKKTAFIPQFLFLELSLAISAAKLISLFLRNALPCVSAGKIKLYSPF